MKGRLRAAMIGGGPGSFIGGVHRIAARMDGEYDLVAGAFSSKPEKCLETARELGISEDRAYGSWKELIEKELDRPENERVQVIMITTPESCACCTYYCCLGSGLPRRSRQAPLYFHGGGPCHC